MWNALSGNNSAKKNLYSISTKSGLDHLLSNQNMRLAAKIIQLFK